MSNTGESKEEKGKVVNARVVSAEIYCSQVEPGEVGHTVELQLKYADGATQKTGRLPASFVGFAMYAVEVSSWSQVVGRVIRARCSRMGVYALGHVIVDEWRDLGEQEREGGS